MNDVLPDLKWIERGDRIALGDRGHGQEVGPPPAGSQDGRQRVRRDHRRRVRRLRRGRGGRASPTRSCAASRPSWSTSGSPTSEAWDVGLPCGGRDRRLGPGAMSPGRFVEIARGRRARGRGHPARGRRAGAKLLVAEGDGAVSGSLGSPELDAQARRDGRGPDLGRDLRAARPDFRRRRRPAAAADPVRRRARRGRAVHAGPGGRLAAVRGRPAAPASPLRSASPMPSR